MPNVADMALKEQEGWLENQFLKIKTLIDKLHNDQTLRKKVIRDRDNLKNVSWLKEKQIYYWGDIDLHGFEILSVLRNYFPNIQSFLMDEETFLKYETETLDGPILKETADLNKEKKRLGNIFEEMMYWNNEENQYEDYYRQFHQPVYS